MLLDKMCGPHFLLNTPQQNVITEVFKETHGLQ